MGGWTGEGKDTIIWDGEIKAKSFRSPTIFSNYFFGDPNRVSHLILDITTGTHIGYDNAGLGTHTIWTGGTIQEKIDEIDIGVWSSTGLNLQSYDLTTTGTISGVNVTSGNNPGHTHSSTTLSVYASGTPYTLDDTQQLLNFGTTDPSLTLTSPGTYLIFSRAMIKYEVLYALNENVVTIKLRRTTNTPADIPNSASSFDLWREDSGSGAWIVDSKAVSLNPIIYTTTNSDDVIQLWGAYDVFGYDEGYVLATEGSIVAIKIA